MLIAGIVALVLSPIGSYAAAGDWERRSPAEVIRNTQEGLPEIAAIDGREVASPVSFCDALTREVGARELRPLHRMAGSQIAQFCRSGPRPKDFFSEPGRFDAYCGFSPEFRLCFVCNYLPRKGKIERRTNYLSSYGACKDRLSAAEQDEFEARVLGLR